ncbi:uncharacterized protein F5Z01DRAFT_636346 [Emericellopsis atlantica]|uniref:Uncharacterized protein n=1 Tax=Emericellopsis atlantica TaxID=2614577 RepID=A0A9P7ZMF8_9HYPO|nr:uncharacterized protein F5Z01DRAFT_636346 [Emericellopsis atlantica]KAG9254270.1 hypothetical protein F5Z01DRAFT_636346 [Emericellopsis atlantica]
MADLAGTTPNPAIAITLLLTASCVATYHILIFYKLFSDVSDPQGATNPEDAIFDDPALARAFAETLHNELSTLATKHAKLQIQKNKTAVIANLYEARTGRLAAYLKRNKEKYKSLKKASASRPASTSPRTDESHYLLELMDYVVKIRENYDILLQAYTVIKQVARQIQEENATIREALSSSSTHDSTGTAPSSLEEVRNRITARLKIENEDYIAQLQTLMAEKEEWEEERTALREAMDSMLHDSTLSHVDDEADFHVDESWLSDGQSGSTSHDDSLSKELQDAIGNGWTSDDGLGDTY